MKLLLRRGWQRVAAMVPHRDQIEHNITAHDRVVATYERKHDEIYNPIEQQRIRAALERAVGFVQSGTDKKTALDFGCGAGNLTGHLLGLGLDVIASDVSPGCLSFVRARHDTGRLQTVRLNGQDMSNLATGSVDIACTYSVLHHVPDYLKAVSEMVRVLRPGGVLVLDHEQSPASWEPNAVEQEFFRLVSRPRSALRYLNVFKPWWYLRKARQIINPRYQEEGDIHTWPDDHIEWDLVRARAIAGGCEILIEEDYLLYRGYYPEHIWRAYRDKCRGDVRMMIGRKALDPPT